MKSNRSDDEMETEDGEKEGNVEAHATETVQGTASQETEDGEKEGNVEAHATETVQGTASQETEDGEKEGNVEAHVTQTVQGTANQETETEARERLFSNLLELQHPTDPGHVLQFNIKYDEAFIRMCENIGPCQPVLSFPKHLEGRSFQKKWYENNPWLEYSPSTDAMFCFSCRLFLNNEKYKSHTNWKTVGLNRWRKALENIKEHSASEAHMCGMVRWNSFKKKLLEAAFEVGELESQAAKDKERERNREVLSRLIAITLFLARQGMSFRGDDETSSSQNQGNFLELVELFSKYDSVIKLHLDAVKERQGTQKRPLVSLLSNRTQNDLIKALAISVKRVIKKKFKRAKSFRYFLMKRQMCPTLNRFPLL